MAAPTLTLDDFARLTAKLDTGEPRDEVLAEAGLTAMGWLEVQATWLEQIAKRVKQGQPTLHQRYVELLDEYREAALEARRAQKELQGDAPLPPEERVAPLLAKAQRAQAAREPASPALPVAPRPVLQVAAPVAPPLNVPKPVAVAAPTATPAATDRRRPYAGTMAIPEMHLDVGKATPFGTTPTASAPRRPSSSDPSVLPFKATSAEAHDAAPPSSHDAKGDTLDEANDLQASPLPFKPSAQPIKPPPAPAAPKKITDLAATLDVAPEEIAKARAGLPFTQRRDQVERDDDPKREVKDPLASTAYVSPELMAQVRAALPFSGGDKAPTPARKRPSAPDHALPFTSHAEAPISQVPDTVPQLTVEQYAWLCAMLELSPDREKELLSWLRMTPQVKGQLDVHWRHELKRDHALKAQFDLARDKYMREGIKR